MPDSAAIRHDHPISVDASEIDFMGHVNNAHYLKWVQDAVIDHWRALAPAEAVAAHLWVALKHEITYRRPTFLDDPAFLADVDLVARDSVASLAGLG